MLPGTGRVLGAPKVITDALDANDNGAYLSDPGGAWCGRGVLAGDKLLFTGCSSDGECDQAAGFQCVRDPGAFTDVTQGMCLPIDSNKGLTADHWSQACGKLLRSQRKFRILHAQQGRTIPTAAAAPARRSLDARRDLRARVRCQTRSLQHGRGLRQGHRRHPGRRRRRVRAPAACVDADGAKRCILPCSDTTKDSDCGVDFECQPSVVDPIGPPRCMRAPIGDADYWATCMPEVQQYEIHAGDAFTVAGSASGYLANEIADQGSQRRVHGSVADARVGAAAPVARAAGGAVVPGERRGAAAGRVDRSSAADQRLRVVVDERRFGASASTSRIRSSTSSCS